MKVKVTVVRALSCVIYVAVFLSLAWLAIATTRVLVLFCVDWRMNQQPPWLLPGGGGGQDKHW